MGLHGTSFLACLTDNSLPDFMERLKRCMSVEWKLTVSPSFYFISWICYLVIYALISYGLLHLQVILVRLLGRVNLKRQKKYLPLELAEQISEKPDLLSQFQPCCNGTNNVTINAATPARHCQHTKLVIL